MKVLRWAGVGLLVCLATTCKEGRVTVRVAASTTGVQLLFPIDQSCIATATPAFDWTDAETAASYRLQVSPNADFSVLTIDQLVATSTHTPATPLSEDRRYYWRVQVIEADGFTLEWTSSSWFIVGVTPPTTATDLVSPLNRSTVTGVPEPVSVTFDWTDVSGVQYNFQVSPTSAFTSLASNLWLSTSTATVNLSYGTYYWRVFTVNLATLEAAPSVMWQVHVAAIPPPMHTYPPNGAVMGPTDPNYPYPFTFDWTNVTQANGYTIQISTSADFSGTLGSFNIGASQYASPPLSDGTYYWRVRANSQWGSSPWTEPWSVEIDATAPFTPRGPLLIKPINNAKVKSPTPTFFWTSTASTNYRIQVSDSAAFSTTLVDQTVAARVFTSPVSLARGVYYWRVRGINPDTHWSLSRRLYVGVVAGDLNNDGYPDLVLGSRYTPGGLTQAGRVRVFFGGPTLAGSKTADQANVFFDGVEGLVGANKPERFGDGIALCDVNGDLIDDLVVGALGRDATAGQDSGRTYIWFGGATFPTSGTYTSNTASVMIEGEAAGDWLGFQPDVLGDVNNDGIFDLGIAAYHAGYGGKTMTGAYYVFYGRAVWPAVLSAANADVRIYGEEANDRLGFHNHGTAGDFNADGYDDISVASRWNSAAAPGAGRGYIVLGGPQIPALLDLSTSPSGVVVVDGEPQSNGYFGMSAHKIGDVNGDGYSDLMVGSGSFQVGGLSDVGKAWVFYGRPSPITNFVAASANFQLSGQSQSSKLSCAIQSSCGDIDNDLYDEIAVGESGYNATTGRLVIYKGSPVVGGPYTSPAGADIVIEGEGGGSFGTTVVPVGDINGDGFSDLATCDYTFDFGGVTDCGRFYLFYGGPALTSKAGYPSLSAAQADLIITGQTNEIFGFVIGTIRY